MSDLIPHLFYYLLLLMAVGGYLFAALRRRPGAALQQMMVWAMIFLGVTALAGIWPDIRAAIAPAQRIDRAAGTITLPRAVDGHFYLEAQVNGAPLRFAIDTGATGIVLSQADARRAGIDPAGLAYIGRAFTANGEVATAPVRLATLAIGPFASENVAAVVNRGDLDTSLLGMSYLSRFGKVEFDERQVVLHP